MYGVGRGVGAGRAALQHAHRRAEAHIAAQRRASPAEARIAGRGGGAALWHAELRPPLCDSLGLAGRLRREGTSVLVSDACCCVAEVNTVL